jgi:hypothetical protein
MIKKFNELYDNDDLKNKFEIPHLRGEMNVSKFKNITLLKDIDESTELAYERLAIEYPVLSLFNIGTKNIGGSTNMVAISQKSVLPVDLGDGKFTYFAQFSFYYSDDIYGICIIMRDVDETDEKYWQVHEYHVDDMKDFYSIFDSFMLACVKLNIVGKDKIFNPRRN